MRKVLSLALVLTLGACVPGVGFAAQQGALQPAKLTGVARNTSGRPLPNATVQLRNFGVGEVVSRTTSGPAGQFVFEGLQPGRYIVEVIEGSKVMGMSTPLSAEAGMVVNADITVLSAALDSSAPGAGFSLFGLGPAVSTAVLGAAGAAAVTAVVSTRSEASPSR